jgi:hypothetical protein
MPFTQVIISIICPKHGPWHMIAVDPLLPLLPPPPPPPVLLLPPPPLPLLLLLLLLPPLPLLLPPLPLPLPPLPLLLPLLLTLMPIDWRHPFITCHATFSFFNRVSICIFIFQMYIYLESNTCAKRQRTAIRRGQTIDHSLLL